MILDCFRSDTARAAKAIKNNILCPGRRVDMLGYWSNVNVVSLCEREGLTPSRRSPCELGSKGAKWSRWYKEVFTDEYPEYGTISRKAHVFCGISLHIFLHRLNLAQAGKDARWCMLFLEAFQHSNIQYSLMALAPLTPISSNCIKVQDLHAAQHDSDGRTGAGPSFPENDVFFFVFDIWNLFCMLCSLYFSVWAELKNFACDELTLLTAIWGAQNAIKTAQIKSVPCWDWLEPS